MEKNIVIVHFNTPLLTECLIHSINHFTPNTNIYIFDNSDKEPFTAKFDNVTIIDNTKGQIINFDDWLKGFQNKINGLPNDYASARHCYTIQKCMDIIQNNFILLDSDVLLKRDIGDLFDEKYAYIGEIGYRHGWEDRIMPFICFINVNFCKDNDISYFDSEHMFGIDDSKYKYDTGAWFYKLVKDFNHKDIKVNDYIVHFGSASWVNKKNGQKNWLNRYMNLWNFCGNLTKTTISKELKKSTRKSYLFAKRKKIIQMRLKR